MHYYVVSCDERELSGHGFFLEKEKALDTMKEVFIDHMNTVASHWSEDEIEELKEAIEGGENIEGDEYGFDFETSSAWSNVGGYNFDIKVFS